MKELDWSNIGFGYRKTDYNVRCCYRNGAWGEIEVSSSEYINSWCIAWPKNTERFGLILNFYQKSQFQEWMMLS